MDLKEAKKIWKEEAGSKWSGGNIKDKKVSDANYHFAGH
jgi:hypothetical protein